MATPRLRLDVELEAYLAHLAVERGLATNTLAAYRRDLSRYVAYLTGRGVETIGGVAERDIEMYVETIRLGSDGKAALSASSTARALAAVRGWHRFVVNEGQAESNPSGEVRPPSRPTRLPHALAVEEVVALIDAAGRDESPAGLRDRALVEFLYGTGARISEAIALDVDDLDLEPDKPATRLFGKGGKERVVPVGRYAREAVEAYLVRGRPSLAARGTGAAAVFLNQRGRRLSRQSAWKIVQTAAEAAHVSVHVSPHTLRHSYATHLLAGGADIRVVQDLLGHASVTTTQLYTHVTVDTLREVYVTAHPRGHR